MLRRAATLRRFSSVPSRAWHVAVVGSGPAAFYATDHLLKNDPDVHVEMSADSAAYNLPKDAPIVCFLHTITMVDINVDVQDSRMRLEQLEDCEDDIVQIAEAARLTSLGVVHAT